MGALIAAGVLGVASAEGPTTASPPPTVSVQGVAIEPIEQSASSATATTVYRQGMAAAVTDGQAKAHNMTREQVIHDVLLAQQPNKRFATVEEMGALAAFLCSDAAASITGTAMPVDGGWTAH